MVDGRAAARHQWRRGAYGAALAVALATVPACTVVSRQDPGQATAAVAGALSQASSAGQTVRLTVELLDAGRVTGPVADTAIRDQLGVLDDAELALTTLVPPDATSSDARSTGMAAVGELTTVVVTAREWVAARSGDDLDGAGAVPPSTDALLGDLEDATAAVDAAAAEAGAP